MTDVKGHPITVSIEVEKTKPELVNLIPLADVVSSYMYRNERLSRFICIMELYTLLN